jgi:type IV fimbrial biogenesis protein FimT
MRLNKGMKQRMKQMLGFTLTELMVVVAIVGIIAGIAAPSFAAMIRENTARAQVNELLALAHYARSEAIKRQSTVSLVVTTPSAGGWKGEVTVGTVLLKEMDKTATGTKVSAVNLGFDLRGRRTAGSANCLSVAYSGYQRQLQIGVGGTLKVVGGSCTVASA